VARSSSVAFSSRHGGEKLRSSSPCDTTQIASLIFSFRSMRRAHEIFAAFSLLPFGTISDGPLEFNKWDSIEWYIFCYIRTNTDSRTSTNGLGGTPTWSQLSPSGDLPTPRSLHSTFYDATNNRMIVFGGRSWSNATQSFTALGDLWELSNANGLGGAPSWTQLSPSGVPPDLNGSSFAAWDNANQRMIVLTISNGAVQIKVLPVSAKSNHMTLAQSSPGA
jgi:hypothetical protein